jgi:mannose-6-phosphate isomerase-like protein (cupin superfamily)
VAAKIGRRVVTGLNSSGKSCVLSDGGPELILTNADEPGSQSNFSQVNWMWSTDEVPDLPYEGDGTSRPPELWFPGPGGTRLIIETLGPEFGVRPVPDEALERGAQTIADMEVNFNARYIDSNGVHSSDTIDYAIVISGRLWLETGDGNETVLEAGDCVVQMGVRHTWRNRDKEPCQVAFIMVGATRTEDPEQEQSS